jgi:hypothetical protein
VVSQTALSSPELLVVIYDNNLGDRIIIDNVIAKKSF